MEGSYFEEYFKRIFLINQLGLDSLLNESVLYRPLLSKVLHNEIFNHRATDTAQNETLSNRRTSPTARYQLHVKFN